MAASILSLGGPVARRRRDPTKTFGITRELTNGAPCLGLAAVAGGLVWGLLGSAVALLLP